MSQRIWSNLIPKPVHTQQLESHKISEISTLVRVPALKADKSRKDLLKHNGDNNFFKSQLNLSLKVLQYLLTCLNITIYFVLYVDEKYGRKHSVKFLGIQMRLQKCFYPHCVIYRMFATLLVCNLLSMDTGYFKQVSLSLLIFKVNCCIELLSIFYLILEIVLTY